jgi:hypothetical protein
LNVSWSGTASSKKGGSEESEADSDNDDNKLRAIIDLCEIEEATEELFLVRSIAFC